MGFWGCLGRVMQTTMPTIYFTLLLESLLVIQEVYQVVAYMHQMGPTAFTIRLIAGRGKVPKESSSTTCTYRSVRDIPPKVFAYNSMITVHAVCEAILVLVGGLIPLVLNVNLVDS